MEWNGPLKQPVTLGPRDSKVSLWKKCGISVAQIQWHKIDTIHWQNSVAQIRRPPFKEMVHQKIMLESFQLMRGLFLVFFCLTL